MQSLGVVIALLVVFGAGAGSGYLIGSMPPTPAPVVTLPTCEDAISRASALGAITVKSWGASYEATLEVHRPPVGYVVSRVHGRTPQEAMRRAMEIAK